MGHEGRERERERESACVCRVSLCSIGPGTLKNRANFPPPRPYKISQLLSHFLTQSQNRSCGLLYSSQLPPPPPSPFPSTSIPPLLVRQALSLSFVVVALISFSSCLLCGQSFSREFQRLGCTVLSN